jgi:hypothetical protein
MKNKVREQGTLWEETENRKIYSINKISRTISQIICLARIFRLQFWFLILHTAWH